MPDIRYVILSDLHFGAENSILTALGDGAEPVADPTRRSPSSRPSPTAWLRSSRPTRVPIRRR